MRVERAGAGRPALGEDLHGKQLGVDFRFERPGRPHRALGAVVRFQGLVGPEGHVPGVRLCHGSITPKAAESSFCRKEWPGRMRMSAEGQGLSQVARRQPVSLAEGTVNSSGAVEAAGGGDFGDRSVRHEFHLPPAPRQDASPAPCARTTARSARTADEAAAPRYSASAPPAPVTDPVAAGGVRSATVPSADSHAEARRDFPASLVPRGRAPAAPVARYGEWLHRSLRAAAQRSRRRWSRSAAQSSCPAPAAQPSNSACACSEPFIAGERNLQRLKKRKPSVRCGIAANGRSEWLMTSVPFETI